MSSTEHWKFLEFIVVQIVSAKCNLRDQLCPDKQTKRGISQLGFANNNEQISFNSFYDINDDEDDDDGRTQLIESEITDNENMDRIFEIEIDETLASALDLLPDFLSIPIGEDDTSNTKNIDQCLEILKNINAHSLHLKQNPSNVMNKMCEMRRIIEKLQIEIGDDDDDEGYITNKYDYEYSVDIDDENDSDDNDILIGIHRNSVTLMGDTFQS